MPWIQIALFCRRHESKFPRTVVMNANWLDVVNPNYFLSSFSWTNTNNYYRRGRKFHSFQDSMNPSLCLSSQKCSYFLFFFFYLESITFHSPESYPLFPHTLLCHSSTSLICFSLFYLLYTSLSKLSLSILVHIQLILLLTTAYPWYSRSLITLLPIFPP